MGGIFMRYLKRIMVCLVFAAAIWSVVLLTDRKTLNEDLIRLHVVANSDSSSDQEIKLRVRDAVLAGLRQDLSNIRDIQQAKTYLQYALPRIEKIAEAVLNEAGVDARAVVTLCKETFDTRYYDTFALPAGVYESLRIVIGEGRGHNWWCVAFPSLCAPDNEEEFQSAAVSSGFSQTLTDTLSGDGYEIRFFALDLLGRLENILFEEK